MTRRGSVTCSKRSDTARRRTAASRSDSTASCAILCGTPSIRDVIAFPKTAKGTCLMTESPTPVSTRQLRDLYIDLKEFKR